MGQTTDRNHHVGRRLAIPSHPATKESNVYNPTNAFDHTGWHLEGDQPVYLHAGGAIGPSGPVAGIQPQLGQGLDRFALPDPPDAGDPAA